MILLLRLLHAFTGIWTKCIDVCHVSMSMYKDAGATRDAILSLPFRFAFLEACTFRGSSR